MDRKNRSLRTMSHGLHSAPVPPDLSLCSAKRHILREGLRACTNFAIAGTASSTLARALSEYSNATNWDHTMLWPALRRRPMHTGRLPRCLIATLRDPASRLASGFRYDLLYGHLGQVQGLCAQWRRDGGGCPPNATAAFVSALRRMDEPRAQKMYRSSAGAPTFGASGGPQPDGSFFLVSQAHYLSRGLNCSAPDAPLVHVLCAERFDDDFGELLARYGHPVGRTARHGGYWASLTAHATSLGAGVLNVLTGTAPAARGVSHRMWRSAPDDAALLLAAANASRLAVPELKARVAGTALGEEDARFVREALFPWDAELHARYCGSGRATAPPPSRPVT